MNSMMRFAKTQPLGAVGFLIILLILSHTRAKVNNNQL